MGLETAVQEVVVPDIHNKWAFYQSLTRIVDGATSKVFLVGDLRDQIDESVVHSAMARSDFQTLAERLASARSEYDAVLERHSGEENFISAARQGAVSQADIEVYKKHAQASKAAVSIQDSAFAEESNVDYSKHEQFVKSLKEAHSNVQFFGVPGNHDTVFIKDQVPSVDWLVYTQNLSEEGIVGAFVCREEVGELQPAFNGPGLRYVPCRDDDYADLSQSPLFQRWQSHPIDLVVTHSGGNWGSAHNDGKYKTGVGITELGKLNGFVCYEGHLHDGLVYRDPESKVLVIRPGTEHIAKVWRDGKEVVKIEMYRVPV